MSESVTLKLIDIEAAKRAANRSDLACTIGDALNDYTDGREELFASALTTMMVTLAFAFVQINMPRRQAGAEFSRIMKSVEATVEALGADTTLNQVMTELHLDHTPDRKRRK